MFFRQKKTPSGIVLQLTQAYRNKDDKPRQRIVVSLGNSDIPETDRPLVAQRVALLLSGKKELIVSECNQLQQSYIDKIMRLIEKRGIRALAEVVGPANSDQNIAINLDEIEHSHGTSAGPELLGLHAWNALQLTQALEQHGFNDAQIRAAQASVINRLVEPVSEHNLGTWLENVSSLPDLLGETFSGAHVEGRFYRVSDLLYENASALETHLREQQKKLFGGRPTIFLYDLTNTYFEGKARANPDAKHGHSKEKRTDCPLVSLALAFSQDGMPLGHKVFPGNQNDAASFPEVIARLETDWKDLCSPDMRTLFVMDCGIATSANLRLLRQKGCDYLVSEKRSKRTENDALFADRESFTKIKDKGVQVKMQTTLIPAEAPLEIAPTQAPDDPSLAPCAPLLPEKEWQETRLFCYSEARGEKEKAMLAKARGRCEEDLKSLSARIEKGHLTSETKVFKAIGRLCERHSSVSRFYEISPQLQTEEPKKNVRKPQKKNRLKKNDRVVFALNWTPKQDGTGEDHCGNYCLRSNRSFADAAEMWALYTNLTNAEDGFRCLKSDLGLRPVRHQTKERVHAHIFISIIALHLLCFLKKSLLVAGEEPRTWTTLKLLLRNNGYATLKIKTATATYHIRKLGHPNEIQKGIYDRLGIKLASCPKTKVTVPHSKE